MTALLLVDAIETASDLANAIFLWIVIAAVAFTVLLFAFIAAAVITCRAIRRGVTVAWRAAHATPAPETAETATEPYTPTWARTEKEAA